MFCSRKKNRDKAQKETKVTQLSTFRRLQQLLWGGRHHLHPTFCWWQLPLLVRLAPDLLWMYSMSGLTCLSLNFSVLFLLVLHLWFFAMCGMLLFPEVGHLIFTIKGPVHSNALSKVYVFVVIENASIDSRPHYRFYAFSTVRTITFENDRIARCNVSKTCTCLCISVNERRKRVKMYALLNEDALGWMGPNKKFWFSKASHATRIVTCASEKSRKGKSY